VKYIESNLWGVAVPQVVRRAGRDHTITSVNRQLDSCCDWLSSVFGWSAASTKKDKNSTANQKCCAIFIFVFTSSRRYNLVLVKFVIKIHYNTV